MIVKEEDDSWDKALQQLEKNFLVKVNAQDGEIIVHRLMQKELSKYFRMILTDSKINEILVRFINGTERHFKTKQ